MGRYVLYDYDSDELATTTVYQSYEEATEDASELDNILILQLKERPPHHRLRRLAEQLRDSADDTGIFSGGEITVNKSALEKLINFISIWTSP